MNYKEHDFYQAWVLKMNKLDETGAKVGDMHTPSKARMFAYEIFDSMAARIKRLEIELSWHRAGGRWISPAVYAGELSPKKE